MATAIRLARGGAKKRPYYRIVVADTRAPRDGRYIEKVGSYNPMLPKDSDDRVQLVKERIEYWLGVGAKPTDRVSRFLEAEGLLAKKERNNPNKGKPSKHTLEMLEEKKAKIEAAKEAAEEAAAEAAAAEAAPAEEDSEEATAE